MDTGEVPGVQGDAEEGSGDEIMGWSIGFDEKWNRDIGYGVPAFCDAPRCRQKIDRGLSYVCGGEPYGGDDWCGLYFCHAHLAEDLCRRCRAGLEPYKPKPDHPEWIQHKETDPSWAECRRERGRKPK